MKKRLPKEQIEEFYSKAVEILQESSRTSYARGISYLREAADAGHIKAQYNLGICLHQRQGRYEEAHKYFKKAAKQDHFLAHYMLGCYSALGFIGPASPQKAIRHFRLAADHGIADAQYNLAILLLQREESFEEGIQYLTAAALQNHPDAQYNLGLCYFQGMGVPLSHDKAIYYLELAVKQKQPKAARALETVLMAPLPFSQKKGVRP